MLNDITPEQRAEYLEQGRIARQEKALFAQENLDTDHGEDGKHWAELASLAQESMEIGEKVAWIALWPFLTAVGIALGSGVWLYEIITGNKVRF